MLSKTQRLSKYPIRNAEDRHRCLLLSVYCRIYQRQLKARLEWDFANRKIFSINPNQMTNLALLWLGNEAYISIEIKFEFTSICIAYCFYCGQAKPAVILSVDGGADENQRYPRVIEHAIQHFREHLPLHITKNSRRCSKINGHQSWCWFAYWWYQGYIKTHWFLHKKISVLPSVIFGGSREDKTEHLRDVVLCTRNNIKKTRDHEVYAHT